MLPGCKYKNISIDAYIECQRYKNIDDIIEKTKEIIKIYKKI